VCAIVFVMIILSMFMSHKMALSIVKPLEEFALDGPVKEVTYEELAPIISRIVRQHDQITSQMKELRLKSAELEQIISSMSEGLVLLDRHRTVLSMNESAKRILGIENFGAGEDFFDFDVSCEMRDAVTNALDGKHGEFRFEREGSVYRFIVNRTESDGKTVGVVILCFDVTETAFAERNRREFTANVSHELKTPLQSIIGSAELLESGLVKKEDTPRFVGNIKNEAVRLVSLINDIIRLSQLDENSSPTMEWVDLAEVSAEAIELLRPSAVRKGVSFESSIEPCRINGIRRYLFEIVYNICDNAIRYNKEGGKVTLTLKKGTEGIVLSVSDTGIGIPPEHRERIFERFYRVDKSHSRATGGTGLGLSIVKHAVAFHGGQIRLESTPGVGSVITVIF